MVVPCVIEFRQGYMEERQTWHALALIAHGDVFAVILIPLYLGGLNPCVFVKLVLPPLFLGFGQVGF